MPADLIIENTCIPAAAAPVDIAITGGRVAAVAPAGQLGGSQDGAARHDAAGGLLLPAFVDGHIHLDKTLIGLPFIPHIPGDSVAERIAAERRLHREVTLPVTVRGGLLLEKIAALGTVAVRSHVDIDTEAGLSGLEALLDLRLSHGRLCDIQIVAFPQSGILRDPGCADLLDAACRSGADLIGGLDPAGIDGDVAGHLAVVFRIAERTGAGVDIHLHDGGALGAFELRDIAARARALGLEGRVAVSHAFCLGELDDGDFGRTAEALAGAGVSIMTTGPGPVPMPPVKRLMAAGVRVFSGSDNIRDAWSPFGNGDMLERAGILSDRQDFRADADLELAHRLVTTIPGAVLGRAAPAAEAGAPADFVILPAGSIAEAVADRPSRRLVIKAGRLIARDGRLLSGEAS